MLFYTTDNKPATVELPSKSEVSPFLQTGGQVNQGDEVYLSDDEIKEILANGGEIEYL